MSEELFLLAGTGEPKVGLDSLIFRAPLETSTAPTVFIDNTVDDERGTVATKEVNGVVIPAAIDEMRFEAEGLLMEGASTNEALHNRDFTDAVWDATNVNPLKDATGRDGVSNSASTLTAAATDGTIFQTVTKLSAENTFSIDVRRKTGTGSILMGDGATTTEIGSLINTSTYTRFQITNTQANPVFGFTIAVSGDEIEVDYAQLEEMSFATSRIVTAGVALEREEDMLDYDAANWPTINTTWSLGMTVTSMAPSLSTPGTQTLLRLLGLSGINRIMGIDATPRFKIKPINTSTFPTLDPTTGTYRVVGTWATGGNQKIYVDGVLGDTDSTTNTSGGPITSVRIGRNSNGNRNFYGHIQDIRIYSDELTLSDVENELRTGIRINTTINTSINTSINTAIQ